MKSSIFKKIVQAVSILLFITGLLFSIWALISLNRFFVSKCDNRLPPAGAFLGGKADSFRFAVMSDSGDRHEPIEAIVNDIKKQNVKFILHLGDIARRLKSNHFESILQDFNRLLGDTPLYAIPGNHDALKNKKANFNYYKRAFGQPNYWFGYGNTLIICLNTALGTFDNQQQQWLLNVLQHMRSQFKNCIVFMHVPPVDPRPNETYAMRQNIDALKAILAKFNITALLCGHIHEYNTGTFANIPMFIAPPSGQRMRGKTTMYGYLLCDMNKAGQLTVKNIDITNKKGRNHLTFLLSTELDGITSTLIATILFTSAFILLLFSAKADASASKKKTD